MQQCVHDARIQCQSDSHDQRENLNGNDMRRVACERKAVIEYIVQYGAGDIADG